MSEMGGWGFRRDCQACGKTLGKDWDLWSPQGWGTQDHLPVLNGLRCGGRPKFGHEDADDVEKEDKIDLQASTQWDGVGMCVCKLLGT